MPSTPTPADESSVSPSSSEPSPTPGDRQDAHQAAPATTSAVGEANGSARAALRALDPFTDAFKVPSADSAPRHPASVATAVHPEVQRSGGMAPCHCECGCTRLSEVPADAVVSVEAASWIRCVACHEAGHTKRPAGVPRALRPGQEEFVGSRTGNRIVVAKPHIDEDDAAHNARIEQEVRAQQWDAAAARWFDQVPERFRQPIDEALPPQITDILTRLSAKDGRHYLSMLSIGPFGSGKTWMAYVLARKVVEHRLMWPPKVRILKERALLEPLVTGDQWDRPKVLDGLLDQKRLGMLVIDDVGTYQGGKPEDRVSAYTEIVDWFYVHNLPLVMTTNLTLDQLSKAIGGAAYDRLKNMLGPHGILWREDEMRQKYAKGWEAAFKSRNGIA